MEESFYTAAELLEKRPFDVGSQELGRALSDHCKANGIEIRRRVTSSRRRRDGSLATRTVATYPLSVLEDVLNGIMKRREDFAIEVERKREENRRNAQRVLERKLANDSFQSYVGTKRTKESEVLSEPARLSYKAPCVFCGERQEIMLELHDQRACFECLMLLFRELNSLRAVLSRKSIHSDKAARVYKKHGRVCFYCGVKLNRSTQTVDHRIPVSRGGSDEEENLVPACRKCNFKKGSKTDDEFVQEEFLRQQKWL